MQVLDLFSGIGGFSLGLQRAGMTTVAFCEIEKYCQRVLAKNFPGVPCHNNIMELDGEKFRGSVRLVCGGYPCQGESNAGKRGGNEDERWLWPEMLRVIRGVRPEYVICENVAGHISLGFDTVASQMEAEGFTITAFIIPACAAGAPHRRDRVFIVANRQRAGLERHARDGIPPTGWSTAERPTRKAYLFGQSKTLSYADGNYRLGGCLNVQVGRVECTGETENYGHFGGTQWLVEPDVGRVANGIPSRVDRLKGLGNAVVPQVIEAIGRAIMEFDNAAGSEL